MQNRRKLMPEDVVEVCSMKERFLFLKDDIKDLAKEQRAKEREGERDGGKNAGNEGKKGKHGEEMGGKSTVKTLDSYFGKAR